MNAPPRLLGGRYEVGEVLGRGGMAEVHLGRDTRLGRQVAIKMLRSDLARDPSFLARFKREAQSAASLNHPAVVAVYDSGEEPTDDGAGVPVPYIVMEYVEGRTLRELLSRGRTVPWTEALRITSGVLAALGYSHRAGIVHRDIKPANVMLTPDGDVKVMDFGIARAMADASATMTQTQAVIGTAQYLSPEQARGETVDARSDLYSTGCLLYELVTGRPPFVADSPVAVAYQHVGEAPQPPSVHHADVPHAVDAIVVHALVKDKNGRYQSAEDFKADTDAALAGRAISPAALGSITALAGGAAGGIAGAAATEAMSTQAVGRADEATAALGPFGAGTQRLSPVPVPGATRPVDSLPSRRDIVRDERPSRAGVWVLLALLAAALLALGVLVLPGLLGSGTAAKPNVRVADVTNQTETAAGATLRGQGLVVARLEDVSPDVEAGKVMLQSPTAGTSLPTGRTVTLTISTGPGTVTIPDVTGQTRTDAQRLLEDERLKLGKVLTIDSPGTDAGRVVSSDPAAGASAAPGTSVTVSVSSGKVKVPNVLGQTLAEASKTLTDAGLEVGATTSVESTQPVDTVIAQSGSGATVPTGTKIKLSIAKAAPTPTPTPTDTATVPPAPTDTGTVPPPPA